MYLRRPGLIGFFIAFVGCGDDAGTDDDGTAQTSAATQTTTDATSSGSETSSSGTTTSTSTSTSSSTTDVESSESATTSADSTTGDVDVPCGDGGLLTCSGGDVCVEDVLDPECTNLEDPDGMCPAGQTMTQCGGAGLPCCCLPPPPSEFRCHTPAECDGPATCECLVEVCTDGRACTPLGADPEHFFRCESLPKP